MQPRSKVTIIYICGICLSDFKDPKSLPCSHTFCAECIQQWIAHTAKKQYLPEPLPGFPSRQSVQLVTIKCPKCRELVRLPNGVQGLRTNAYVQATAHLQQVSGYKIPPCMSCGKSDKDPQGRCAQRGWLCGNCCIAHTSMVALRSHRVVDLKHLRAGKKRPNLSSAACFGSWIFSYDIVERTYGRKVTGNDIALSPNGKIAIASVNPETVGMSSRSYPEPVRVVNSESYDECFKLDGTVSVPNARQCGVTVDSRGYYYVVDGSQWVSVYSEYGVYQHPFPIMEPYCKLPSFSFYFSKQVSNYCLSISYANQIVLLVSRCRFKNNDSGNLKLEPLLVHIKLMGLILKASR